MSNAPDWYLQRLIADLGRTPWGAPLSWEGVDVDTAPNVGMTVTQEVQGPPLPAGTTPEQMQVAEEYVRGRIRRYWGLE